MRASGESVGLEYRFSIRRVLLLALIPAANEMMWILFNSYVPLYLQSGYPGFVSGGVTHGLAFGPALSSLVMTAASFLNLFVSPVIGRLSDRPNRRGERRMPYLRFFVVLAAISTCALPFAAMLAGTEVRTSVIFLFLTVLCGVSVANCSIGLLVTALRWDVTPPEDRPKVQAVISCCAAVGTVLITLLGSKIFEIWQPLVFIIVSLFLLLSIVLVSTLHKEPVFGRRCEERREARAGIWADLVEILRERGHEYRKQLILYTAALFFIQMSIRIPQTFMSSYATSSLGMNAGNASMLGACMFLVTVAFAVPVSTLTRKLGLRRTIIAGMGTASVVYIMLYLINTRLMLYAVIGIGGAAMTAVNINVPASMANVAPDAGVLGTLMGMFYFVNGIANMAGPFLTGVMIEYVFNGIYDAIWPMAAGCFAIAILCLAGVKNIIRDR